MLNVRSMENAHILEEIRQGVVVGSCRLSVTYKFNYKLDELWLWALTVSEEYRCQGIATMLLEEAKTYALSVLKWSRLYLYCYEDKVEFYSKRGF